MSTHTIENSNDIAVGATHTFVYMAKHAGKYAPRTWGVPVGSKQHTLLVEGGWIVTDTFNITRTGERSWATSDYVEQQ